MIVLAVLVLLLGIYIGAYYAMLEGQAKADVKTKRSVMTVVLGPKYRIPATTAFFSPAHQMDRTIRSSYWKDVEIELEKMHFTYGDLPTRPQ